jgi:hypothetical protein
MCPKENACGYCEISQSDKLLISVEKQGLEANSNWESRDSNNIARSLLPTVQRLPTAAPRRVIYGSGQGWVAALAAFGSRGTAITIAGALADRWRVRPFTSSREAE